MQGYRTGCIDYAAFAMETSSAYGRVHVYFHFLCKAFVECVRARIMNTTFSSSISWSIWFWRQLHRTHPPTHQSSRGSFAMIEALTRHQHQFAYLKELIPHWQKRKRDFCMYVSTGPQNQTFWDFLYQNVTKMRPRDCLGAKYLKKNSLDASSNNAI